MKPANTVLICGASGGLGQVLATYLQSQGMQVMGTMRDLTRAKPNDVDMIAMNIRDQDSIANALNQARSEMGSIDVVINCVNDMMVGSVEEVSIAELENVYATNVLGNAALVKSVLPIMREQGHGLIVAMSSMGGMLAVPYLSAYTSSKVALEAYMEALYHELKDEKEINVAIMQPVAMRMEREATTGSHLRLAAEANKDSDSFSHKVINLLARDTHQSDLTPDMVAEKIYEVIHNPNRKLRTRLSKAKAIGVLKRVLSQSMLDKLIAGMLNDARKA